MAVISVQQALAKSYDDCVIGAGAAGLALALKLGEAGRRVLVIEKGDFSQGILDPSQEPHEILSPQTHDPRNLTNREAVGGTLHGWGGRCVPFDSEDFEAPAATNEPGWPISYDEYARWIPDAAAFLKTDPVFEEADPIELPEVAGVRMDKVERLNAAQQAQDLQNLIKSAQSPVDLLEQTQLVAIGWDEDAVSEIGLYNEGQRVMLPCTNLVLACGGLETARQLLSVQADRPDFAGGLNGPLGRFYMGHLTGSVAQITFEDAKVAQHFGYIALKGMSPYRRRLTLTERAKLNTSFWVENLPMENPENMSGELSLKYLLSRRGRSREVGKHLRNILRDPMGIPQAFGSASQRLTKNNKRRPQRLIANQAGPYVLAYHAEHLPLFDSRVTLCDNVDETGLKPLKIDFRYGEKTIQALIDSHRLLAERLEHANVARLSLPNEDRISDAILGQSRDGYHQIGLTRMSHLPADGIVDPDCRVHRTKNLYVASASVFPTSGQANPTLTIVALALRLASYLIKGEPSRGQIQ